MLTILGLGERGEAETWGERIWALPWDYMAAPRAEMLFEMHDRVLWERRERGYLERLQTSDVEIVMQRTHDDIPMSVAFPFDHADSVLWRGFPRASHGQFNWYNSSPAYMLAYALLNGEKRIRLEGINVKSDSEFFKEQPCLSYILGWAVAKGVRIEIPQRSDLCRFNPAIPYIDKIMHYSGRYGHVGVSFEEIEPSRQSQDP